MKRSIILSGIFTVLLVAAISCATKAAPTPALAPAIAPSPVSTLPTTTVASPEETAWQQVVDAAKREGKLTVYSYWMGDTNLALQKAFRDSFGIDIEFIVGKGGSHLERLQTEKRIGKMVADAFFGSTLHPVNARDLGLTTFLADLPVLREKDVWVLRPDALSPDKQFVNISFSYYPSVVNTKLLKPAEAPHSYRDLLSPAWKGKVIIVSPSTNSAMYNMFLPLLRDGIVNMDYIKALGKQDIHFYPSTEAATMALGRGERPFLLTGASSVINQFIAEGSPIRPVVMEEGTTVQMSPGGVVVKGAPHPNAAKLFLNWLLTQKGQDVYHKALSTPPMRKDVSNYTPVAAQFSAKKLVNLTLEDLEKSAKMFTDRVFPKLWEE